MSPAGTILLVTDIVATGGDIFSQSTDDAGSGRAVSLSGNDFVINNAAVSFLALTTGLHAIVCTWGGSSAHSGYIDDVAQAAYGPSGGAPLAAAGNYFFELGAFSYSGGRLFFSNHTPYLLAVWSRILSRAEISVVSRTPWRLFVAADNFAGLDTGGAAPNITAVYADSVTSSSVVPRVTLDFA